MLFPSFKPLAQRCARFLAEAPHSLRNHLNIDELSRVLLAAFWAGGGIFGLLELVVAQVGGIFPSPADAGFAAAVLTALLEAWRRLSHGSPAASKNSQIRR